MFHTKVYKMVKNSIIIGSGAPLVRYRWICVIFPLSIYPSAAPKKIWDQSDHFEKFYGTLFDRRLSRKSRKKQNFLHFRLNPSSKSVSYEFSKWSDSSQNFFEVPLGYVLSGKIMQIHRQRTSGAPDPITIEFLTILCMCVWNIVESEIYNPCFSLTNLEWGEVRTDFCL